MKQQLSQQLSQQAKQQGRALVTSMAAHAVALVGSIRCRTHIGPEGLQL